MLSLKTWCCGKPVKPLLWDSTCVSLHCSAALSALREIWWLYSKCTYLSWCSCKDRNNWERWRAAKGSKPQRERKGWETEGLLCARHVCSASAQLQDWYSERKLHHVVQMSSPRGGGRRFVLLLNATRSAFVQKWARPEHASVQVPEKSEEMHKSRYGKEYMLFKVESQGQTHEVLLGNNNVKILI